MSIKQISWRGPRPLTPDDQLYGRVRELRELVDRCQSYDIVEITAPSGVGKTSFVTAGGNPALTAAGYHVAPITKWSEALKHPALEGNQHTLDFANVLYRIAIGLDGADLELDDRSSTELATAAAGGRKLVVILDQMDELLRYRRHVGNALLELAGHAAFQSHVPHVVIARTEFRERLSPVEVRGAQVWNLYLGEITSPRALSEIIAKPAAKHGVTIDDDTVGRIVDWWREAKANAGEYVGTALNAAGSDIGLLHLQALLVSLQEWAEATGHGDESVIDAAMLEEFAEHTAGREQGGPRPTRLIHAAVVGHVENMVTRATAEPTVIRDGKLRSITWVNGPRVMLARIAPALVAGTYKVPQTMESMIGLALADEFQQRTARDIGSIYRDGAAAGAELESLYSRSKINADAEGVALARRWSAARVIAEMVDALESIVEALSDDEANVLRKYNVTDEPVYELVHDGIGAALAQWATAFQNRTIAKLDRIVANSGWAMTDDLEPATFTTGPDAKFWRLAGSEPDGRVAVAFAQWASYYIGSPAAELKRLRIERLIFRNSVFNGAAFVRCDLSGVTFIDCWFAGAAFIDCQLHNVTFDASTLRSASFLRTELDDVRFVGSESGALEQLSFDACNSTTVTFEGVGQITGIVARRLQGGDWRFERCSLRHIAVEATERVTVKLVGTSLSHATLAGPVNLEDDGQTSYVEIVSTNSSSDPGE